LDRGTQFDLRLNPVGVVPKGNGGRRLISHLSSPLGESVNDFIDPNLCSVSYSRFEDAIKKIQKLGKSTQLGIKDISLTMNIHLFPVCQEI
jgi:hypothetical protein